MDGETRGNISETYNSNQNGCHDSSINSIINSFVQSIFLEISMSDANSLL